MYKIGYEQTDKKTYVDIYGLTFETKKISNEILNEIKKIENEGLEDFNELYKYVDLFLGEGASEKINAKREQDGYDKMNYEVVLAIIELVVNVQKNIINSYGNRAYKNNNYRRKRY